MNTAVSRELTLETLSQMFRDYGAKRLFLKRLAPNDNSKNQIYLGGDLSVLTVLPSGELVQSASSSRKAGGGNRQILKSRLLWSWLDTAGCAHPAPSAQLILYPQYPEVRLSGFLQGCGIELGKWLDPRRGGRLPGRILLLAVTPDGQVFGHLALPGSVLDRQLATKSSVAIFGALFELPFVEGDGTSRLLSELRRIHNLGWITGKRLGRNGELHPCNSQHCGGYTLEAELGISPNGFSEPDYLGWEIKSFTVTDFDKSQSKVITLMTPEPDGGLYKDKGPEAFVRQFGYPDVSGRPDRLNFGGAHVFAKRHARTGLRLTLSEYDLKTHKICDVNGGIALVSEAQCAASWSFKKLIEHWKRKHDKAAYVANKATPGPPRRYLYADSVYLGRSSAFDLFLGAFMAGQIYYDPGIKLEGASDRAPRLKRRNQFRVKARHLGALYRTFVQLPT